MAYLGNSPFQLSQLPSATIPFTGSQFAVNLVPNTVSALDLGSPSNPWRNVYGNVVGAVTNVAGGAANRIPYQTAANTTSFVAAPTVTDTYLKWNSSTGFAWSAVTGGVTGTSTSNQTSVGSIYELNAGAANAVAIGSLARVSNGSYNSVVIGHNARTTVYDCYDSVVIGKDAYSGNFGNTVIGSGSIGSGNRTTVVGNAARGGYATGGTVLGYNAQQADGYDYGIAIGFSAYSSGGRSIALGQGTNATGQYAIGIGDNVASQGTNSIVIGRNGNDTGVANTIILNASSTNFVTSSSGFYVKPITSGTTSNALYYDSTSGLITYGPGGGGSSLVTTYNGALLTPSTTTIDFTGAGLTATYAGGTVTVNVAAASSGGSSAVTLTTTKIEPSMINDMGGYFNIDFTSPAVASYVNQTLTSIKNASQIAYMPVMAFASSTMPDRYVNWQIGPYNTTNYSMGGPATVQVGASNYSLQSFNPNGQKFIGMMFDSQAGVTSVSLQSPSVLSIAFNAGAILDAIVAAFTTNMPSDFTGYSYSPGPGSMMYNSAANTIVSVAKQGMNLIVTSSQPFATSNGGPPYNACGFNFGITTSSGGGSSAGPTTVLKAGMFVQLMNNNGMNVVGGGRIVSTYQGQTSYYGGAQSSSMFFFAPEMSLPQYGGYTQAQQISIWTTLSGSGTSGTPMGPPNITLDYYSGDSGMQSWYVDNNMRQLGFSLSSSGAQKFTNASLTGMTVLPYQITQAL